MPRPTGRPKSHQEALDQITTDRERADLAWHVLQNWPTGPGFERHLPVWLRRTCERVGSLIMASILVSCLCNVILLLWNAIPW